METWLIVAAYLLGFILLQIVLYQYFIRGSGSRGGTAETARAESTDGTPGHAPEGTPSVGPDGSPARPVNSDADEELVTCGECGAYNRQNTMFVYCRECGEKLD